MRLFHRCCSVIDRLVPLGIRIENDYGWISATDNQLSGKFESIPVPDGGEAQETSATDPLLAAYLIKAGKPVGIDLHIGRKPILAASNVRSGGNIALLTYCQSNTLPSLQILINHDDSEREFAYAEKDNASLNAAKENGWHVVSMKNDWKRVFAFEK